MPRRRMIDWRFWSDKKFFLRILRGCELVCHFKTRSFLFRFARDVRLFFIGLWNFADDEGRFINDLVQLKGEIVPFDEDFGLKKIKKVLQVLQKAKRIFIYEVDDVEYGHIVNFKKHQTINRPTPSTLPPPPEDKFNEWLTEDVVSDSGVTPSQVKLSEVKLSKVNKESLAPSAVFSDQQTVEKFISKKTTFGSGGKQRNLEFRDEVKKVCLAYIARLQEWGEETEDENKAVNKIFGLMMSLICYGVPKKPKKIKNFQGHFTEPQKAIQLINRMSKPKNPVAELVDAFKKQPQYLK